MFKYLKRLILDFSKVVKDEIKNFSLKNFLTSNEIYFTTICSLFLSIMAIIISVVSFNISEKQYEMEYYEKSPDFQIQEVYYKNPETKMVTDSKLVFTKLSGKAKNVHIEVANFAEIEVTDHLNREKKELFKLDGYYIFNFLTGKLNDTIQISAGDQNHAAFIKFQSDVEKMLKTNYQYVSCDLKTFAKISYLNFENKHKNEYYEITYLIGEVLNDTVTASNYFNENSSFNYSNKRINLNRSEKSFENIIKSIAGHQ